MLLNRLINKHHLIYKINYYIKNPPTHHFIQRKDGSTKSEDENSLLVYLLNCLWQGWEFAHRFSE